MSVGVNIAIFVGTALVTRAVSNAAYSVTLPQVDPAMPSAGPVLAAAGVPAIGGGLALYWKSPKVSAALFGLAAGGAISTAEYMAFAKSAQPPASLPAGQTYTWILVHQDASLETAASGTFDLAQVAQQDSAIVNKYGPDPDILMIVRKDAAGNQSVLAQKTPPILGPKQQPAQSGEIVRVMMRRG